MRKGWKRVHRLVVLPDYQGCGIGTKFINCIADIITNEGYRLNLTTTTPSLSKSLIKSKDWCLIRYGRSNADWSGYSKKYGNNQHLINAESNSRITYSFNYKNNT